jgi:dihydroorotase
MLTTMDPARTATTITRDRDVIVGIKTAHFAKPGWAALDHPVGAGRRAGVPVMVDDKIFTNAQRTTQEELLDHLVPATSTLTFITTYATIFIQISASATD